MFRIILERRLQSFFLRFVLLLKILKFIKHLLWEFIGRRFSIFFLIFALLILLFHQLLIFRLLCLRSAISWHFLILKLATLFSKRFHLLLILIVLAFSVRLFQLLVILIIVPLGEFLVRWLYFLMIQLVGFFVLLLLLTRLFDHLILGRLLSESSLVRLSFAFFLFALLVNHHALILRLVSRLPVIKLLLLLILTFFSLLLMLGVLSERWLPFFVLILAVVRAHRFVFLVPVLVPVTVVLVPGLFFFLLIVFRFKLLDSCFLLLVVIVPIIVVLVSWALLLLLIVVLRRAVLDTGVFWLIVQLHFCIELPEFLVVVLLVIEHFLLTCRFLLLSVGLMIVKDLTELSLVLRSRFWPLLHVLWLTAVSLNHQLRLLKRAFIYLRYVRHGDKLLRHFSLLNRGPLILNSGARLCLDLDAL